MPRNKVTVGGSDLYAEYGLVLSDDYEIGIPEYKEYTFDLLGDGVIDASAFSGDVFFKNREIKLPMFIARAMSQAGYERLKSKLATALHGREAEVELAVDPGFTYKGRVKAFTFKRVGKVPTCEIVLDAEPYKVKGTVVFRINGAGGVRFLLENGRGRSQPTVEVYRPSVITHVDTDQTWEVEAGTWKIEDFWLHDGLNLIAVDTAPDYRSAKWQDYAQTKWQELEGKMWAEMSAGDEPIKSKDIWQNKQTIWAKACSKTWLEFSESTSANPHQYDPEQYMIYFAYEWRDL